MSDEEVGVYVDANGNTWQLTASQAKARGFKVAKAEKVTDKAEKAAEKAIKVEEVADKVVTPARAANKSRRKK